MTDSARGQEGQSEAVTGPASAAMSLGVRVELEHADAVTAMATAVGLSAQSLAKVLPQMRRLGLRGPGYDPAMPTGFEYDMLAGMISELFAWARTASTAADGARSRLIVVRRTLLRPD